MKVAVIGASGHVGSAVLAALDAADEVKEVVGIARRQPDTSAAPYSSARWELVDIGVPAVDDRAEEQVLARLADALDGVDTVVHLAWQIQPNRHREVIRRTNVEGTRRVALAARRAGVGHLVAASSVGVYSPVEDDRPRDESWETEGTPSSHYSVDKVAQERILDEAETAGMAVTRIRSALVFDGPAAAEVTRLFIGPLLPPQVLRPGSLPFLPVPAGLRLQVVHGDDLADAYCKAVVGRTTGAFNIAAEPLLHGSDLAAILDHGRVVEIPAALLRPVVSAGWRARALVADPGWLDMGMGVPVMDCARARAELGWTPTWEAADAARDLFTGIADGQGRPSPPLRPHRRWPQDQQPPGDVRPDSPTEPDPDLPDHRLPRSVERDILGLYLSDHLTGATAGVERLQRMARAYADTELGPDLATIAEEIGGERQFLKDLIDGLEVRSRPHRRALAWVGEKVGRLKTNGRLTGSPMTPILEIELLRGGVIGKLGAWQAMEILAPELGLPPELFADLGQRARKQSQTLERLHAVAVSDGFATRDAD